MTKIIKKYTTPESPGSFSGISGFKRNTKIKKNNRYRKTIAEDKCLHVTQK